MGSGVSCDTVPSSQKDSRGTPGSRKPAQLCWAARFLRRDRRAFPGRVVPAIRAFPSTGRAAPGSGHLQHVRSDSSSAPQRVAQLSLHCGLDLSRLPLPKKITSSSVRITSGLHPTEAAVGPTATTQLVSCCLHFTDCYNQSTLVTAACSSHLRHISDCNFLGACKEQ